MPIRPPRYHANLLNNIGEQITGNYVAKLRSHMITEGFGAGCVERKSPVNLLWLLDRKRLIAPGKYDILQEILIDMGRKDLVDLHLDGVMGRNIVTDKELSKLSNELGEEWKSFGLEQLGVTKADIDKCIAESRLVKDQMLNMLHMWKHREGARATKECLREKLESHSVDRSCIDCLK